MIEKLRKNSRSLFQGGVIRQHAFIYLLPYKLVVSKLFWYPVSEGHALHYRKVATFSDTLRSYNAKNACAVILFVFLSADDSLQ